ncbi:type IV secretion protein Rhs [Neisseria dumasiana]|uniref:type IV secretion protein Rhs n=1 Tax=Neisseria dumasiana TaxID=1931275 RepID=UPI000A21B8C6|nr:type IV secretion protein Rhs [Neisseria dumasiana]OSI16166.1 hypothetical protein BV914_04950 [Neisseria dumasiana]
MDNNRKRPLTRGEIETARLVFSDGIDYSRVHISRGIPLMPALKVAMVPNGNIYFPPDDCPCDFTESPEHYRVWLIHELTHVWQYQLGYRTWLGGMLLSAKGGYINRSAYAYPPPAEVKAFSELNMEQQADFVAHYYATRHLKWAAYLPDLPHYERVLKPLLENPHRRSLLPAYANKLPWFGLAKELSASIETKFSKPK